MIASRIWLPILGAAIITGCSRAQQQGDTAGRGDSVPANPRAPTPASETGGGGSQASDISRLEAEVRALAKTGGCQRVEQCRSAPLGSKACGGPRTYISYCSLTTDSVALDRKLEELRRAEDARNRREQIGSDCSMAMPPTLEVSGGSCRARSDLSPVPQ
jgi:hypothetical protein